MAAPEAAMAIGIMTHDAKPTNSKKKVATLEIV